MVCLILASSAFTKVLQIRYDFRTCASLIWIQSESSVQRGSLGSLAERGPVDGLLGAARQILLSSGSSF